MTKALLCITNLFFYYASQAQQNDKPKMFRDNVSHNSIAASNLVYDTKTWSFFANAPVRSTPLIKGNSIFFGNTQGNFYAINKTTGKLLWQFNTGFAINSSAAIQNEQIFFADNKQTVYALKETTGQL